MQTITVYYQTDARGKPTGRGRVELRPELQAMAVYEQMTSKAIAALTAAKRARLPIEINPRRWGLKLIVEMEMNGSGAEVYVTKDIVIACRCFDDVTLTSLAATALLAVNDLAKQHFPKLVD